MTETKKAESITTQMLEKDYFSQWLGIRVTDIGPGHCTLQMTVRQEMLNGFGIAHGGITYSLADSAFAFASNSRGRHAVSIDTLMSHTLPVKEGEQLTAIASEESLGHRIGHYRILIQNQDQQTVGLFKGTVYRSSREWEINDPANE